MILNHFNIFNDFQLILPEGLFWDTSSGHLLFVDISTGRLFFTSIHPVKVIFSFKLGDTIGHAFPLLNIDKLLVAVDHHLSFFDTKTFEIGGPNLYQINPTTCNTHRFNDGLLINGQSHWFGLMSRIQPDLGCSGSLVSVDKHGHQYFYDGDYVIPNGPILDSTGKLLIHCDSFRKHVYSYCYNGLYTDPRSRFLRLNLDYQQGEPDGMTLDCYGNILIAMYGASAIFVFNPNFLFLMSIDVGHSYPTNVCFAGSNLDRLFVTFAADKARSKFGGICEILNYYSFFS